MAYQVCPAFKVLKVQWDLVDLKESVVKKESQEEMDHQDLLDLKVSRGHLDLRVKEDSLEAPANRVHLVSRAVPVTRDLKEQQEHRDRLDHLVLLAPQDPLVKEAHPVIMEKRGTLVPWV